MRTRTNGRTLKAMTNPQTDTNQASEDELDNILRSLAYDAMESGVDNSKHGYTYSVIDELLPTAKAAIKALIHSEVISVLDELGRQAVEMPMSSRDNINLVHLSTIKEVRSRYER